MVTGLELHGAVKIPAATTTDGDDLQPLPAGLAATALQLPPALGGLHVGLGMGGDQVVHLASGKGGVAGSHQLLRRERTLLTPVQGAAATAIQATTTGARILIRRRPESFRHQSNTIS